MGKVLINGNITTPLRTEAQARRDLGRTPYRGGWRVTYDIVTAESAMEGDVAERGFISKCCTLREAFDLVQETRTGGVDHVDCVEADESPVFCPRWVSVVNGMEYATGDYETRAIHFPDRITPASRVRVARLLNCSGLPQRKAAA